MFLPPTISLRCPTLSPPTKALISVALVLPKHTFSLPPSDLRHGSPSSCHKADWPRATRVGAQCCKGDTAAPSCIRHGYKMQDLAWRRAATIMARRAGTIVVEVAKTVKSACWNCDRGELEPWSWVAATIDMKSFHRISEKFQSAIENSSTMALRKRKYYDY